MNTIVDFKQANTRKGKKIGLRITSCRLLHTPWPTTTCIHGSNIEQGIIMVCTPDLYFQEFKFEAVREMRNWTDINFLERFSQFHGTNEAV